MYALRRGTLISSPGYRDSLLRQLGIFAKQDLPQVFPGIEINGVNSITLLLLWYQPQTVIGSG